MRAIMISAAFTASLATGLVMSVATAIAQHQHAAGGHSGAKPASDVREFVKYPPQLIEHTLANMRDHLHALQEIQEHLGMGHPDVAAKIAESRLGMSSLPLHGAQDVAPYMPQGMQEAGTAMHKAASRFAVVATDVSVTQDYKQVLTALGQLTSTCVACHAAYRIK